MKVGIVAEGPADVAVLRNILKGVRHAVAVEETDAWLLTIHDDGKRDTSAFLDPKKRLDFILDEDRSPRRVKEDDRSRRRSGLRGRSAQKPSATKRYDELSEAFRDGKRLEACARRNRSLHLFVTSL